MRRNDDETLVRNRRLRYFEKVLSTGDYMGEEAMRERDPSGWTHHIGRNGDEVDGPSQGLGGFFLTTMERQQRRFVEFVQNENEKQVEEDLKGFCWLRDDNNEGGEEEESLADRMLAWQDLHKMRFISGNDPSFDYSLVDNNDEYDDLKQRRLVKHFFWFLFSLTFRSFAG
jgi:hypothetical protein